MYLFIYLNYLFPSFQHFPILCFIKLENFPIVVQPKDRYVKQMKNELLHGPKRYFLCGKCSGKSKAGKADCKAVQSCHSVMIQNTKTASTLVSFYFHLFSS